MPERRTKVIIAELPLYYFVFLVGNVGNFPLTPHTRRTHSQLSINSCMRLPKHTQTQQHTNSKPTGDVRTALAGYQPMYAMRILHALILTAFVSSYVSANNEFMEEAKGFTHRNLRTSSIVTTDEEQETTETDAISGEDSGEVYVVASKRDTYGGRKTVWRTALRHERS